MAVILWVMGLCLLVQSCLCSVGQSTKGCMQWKQNGANVCCDACHPGNRLVRNCGPNPEDLCTPCEPGTFTVDSNNYRCYRCTQCVGALVLVKQCTTSADTVCGCKEGLTCGDDRCSFCVQKCGKGQEPTDQRACRPCPDGTFNDQSHKMCKPWSTKCPNPDQTIVTKGDAFNDIKCANVSIGPVSKPKQPEHKEPAWPLVLSVVTSVVLMAFSIIIIIAVGRKIRDRKPKEEKEPEKTVKKMIIRPPTDDDDPRTLIAIECSFHEAQQEQGSSSESLASKDSSERLMA